MVRLLTAAWPRATGAGDVEIRDVPPGPSPHPHPTSSTPSTTPTAFRRADGQARSPRRRGRGLRAEGRTARARTCHGRPERRVQAERRSTLSFSTRVRRRASPRSLSSTSGSRAPGPCTPPRPAPRRGRQSRPSHGRAGTLSSRQVRLFLRGRSSQVRWQPNPGQTPSAAWGGGLNSLEGEPFSSRLCGTVAL